MLPKTAVVKESVDQMELVNVMKDFTATAAQVNLLSVLHQSPNVPNAVIIRVGNVVADHNDLLTQ